MRSWKPDALFFRAPVDLGNVVLPDEVCTGIAADTMSGAQRRQRNYINGDRMPRFVSHRLSQGWRIIHHGVVASMPIPRPHDQGKMRHFLVALEGTVNVAFWIMRAETEYGFGLRHLTLWGDRPYRGLNSRSQLTEGVWSVRVSSGLILPFRGHGARI